MTGRERILSLLNGGPADRPGLMPITMMFAADQAGLKYGRYALDYRVLVEAQLRTAEIFGFDPDAEMCHGSGDNSGRVTGR